jgi:ATP-binding cassette subfamily F protein 3
MITIQNLSLQLGTKILFNNIQLIIHQGQKLGFIGANGSGKSSFLALLRNELQADSGNLILPTNLTIAHVAQETPAVSTSALEYILDGDQELRDIEKQLRIAQDDANLHAQLEAIDGYTAKARAAQLMHGLGFAETDINKSVAEFSGGWRMRLNLARALICRSDLLLLDEPTNHLDLDAILWFEQWLKNYPGTLLLISHDRDFLNNVINNIVHLENHSMKLYTGNYESFEQQRAAQLALQQASYKKQQRQINHLNSFVERFRYKATKAKQAQSRLKALERMELIAPAHVASPFNFSFKLPESIPNNLILLDKVSIAYTETPILKNITLRISAGSRIGLLGPNGAGKSSLIKLLAGEINSINGESSLADGLQIGYFAQHQLEQLSSQDSPLQHLQDLDNKGTEQKFRTFLASFGFVGDIVYEPIAPFSGGEKARLALALIVWQNPNILLLDEPTNHLDLEMRHALTFALQDYAGALVIVSHDRHLLSTTTDQLYLVAEQRVTVFDGDLNDYKQWLLKHRAEKKSSSSKRVDNTQRQQRRSLQNRLKSLEKKLETLSNEKQAVETLLADPLLYDDQAKLTEYIQKQAQLTEQLEHTELLWLETSETLEEV